MQKNIGICVIAGSSIIRQHVGHIIELLDSPIQRPLSGNKTVNSHQILFEQLLNKAQKYLQNNNHKHQFRFSIYNFDTLNQANVYFAKHSDIKLDMIIADDVLLHEAPGINSAQAVRHVFYDLMAEREGKLSPNSFMLIVEKKSLIYWQDVNVMPVQLRFKQSDPVIWSMECLKTIVDHLEAVYINPFFSRALSSLSPTSTTAQFIYQLMQDEFNRQWDFYYYTGSVVSRFIDSMFTLCKQNIPCLTGANEHTLAVSALAGWQLYRRGYVITITSGMIDEFRGTLDNLQRAKASGIILCAESVESSWYTFQSTITPEQDGRKVIEARGIPCVYIENKRVLPEKLAEIALLQQKNTGPVFVMATQSVIETTLCQLPDIPLNSNDTVCKEFPDAYIAEALDVIDLINNHKKRILWHCNHLTKQEQTLVYKIAEKAGIALVDTITSPGCVADYKWTRGNHLTSNDEYIGSLSIYGFNRKVFHYLNEKNQLAGGDKQSLFFLKSKIDQVTTPFSTGKLKNKCHIVQINSNPNHISPYTDLGIVSDLLPFLQTILAFLNVDRDVLIYRRNELLRVHAMGDVTCSDRLPQLPMTVNYFYAELADVLHQRIKTHNFSYLGVYDVGRCGMSAIRNLPKTSLGFSGWYGRALMGDAISALPYIARTATENVIAFIGDGARALVPDMTAHIIDEFGKNPLKSKINITVFYLSNGVLSMIQSYIDKRSVSNNVKQIMLLSRDKNNGSVNGEIQNGITIHHEHIDEFEPLKIDALIGKHAQVNFIDISLAHNSDGDGLSLLSESTWHRSSMVNLRSSNIKTNMSAGGQK